MSDKGLLFKKRKNNHGVPKPRAGRYYYGTYPKKWDNSGYLEFSG